MTLAEEHARLVRRLPQAYVAGAPSAEDDHALLVRRLEGGIEQREAILNEERSRHREELAALARRLAESEEREAATHAQLLQANQAHMELSAARRRIAELERSAQHAREQLSSLTDADRLNAQKHALLLETIDAERAQRAALAGEWEEAGRQQVQAREELTRQLAETREELTRQLEEARQQHERTRDELDVLKVTLDRDKAARTQALLLRVSLVWAMGQWIELADEAAQAREDQARLERACAALANRPLFSAMNAWRAVCRTGRVLEKVRRAGRRLIHANLSRCFDEWAEAVRAEKDYLELTRHHPANRALQAATAELRSLHDALAALADGALDPLASALRTADAERREHVARLETEVAALAEALAAKRESCERLRQANSRVLAQFECAEAEFLEAERRRSEAQPTSVVGRLVEVVFGGEPPAHSEAVRNLMSTKQQQQQRRRQQQQWRQQQQQRRQRPSRRQQQQSHLPTSPPLSPPLAAAQSAEGLDVELSTGMGNADASPVPEATRQALHSAERLASLARDSRFNGHGYGVAHSLQYSHTRATPPPGGGEAGAQRREPAATRQRPSAGPLVAVRKGAPDAGTAGAAAVASFAPGPGLKHRHTC